MKFFSIPLQSGIIYGPVNSKRLGKSLGINLLPTTVKVCAFDCLYCFYGRTDFKAGPELCPPQEQVVTAIEQALQKELELDYITFSGNGAATMHPEFSHIVRSTVELRNRYYPGIPLALLSNSTELKRGEITAVIELIDHPIMKLDTADEQVFRRLNRPKARVKLKNIVDNLAKMRGITLQTVLVEGEVANYKGIIWEKWLEAVKTINPQSAQLYSLDDSIPEMGVYKVDDETIFKLAGEAEDFTGVPFKAFKERR